jgi:hypothetical protein
VKVRFVEEAKAEFVDAITYYKQIRPEVGRRFKQEVDYSIDWASRIRNCIRFVAEDIGGSICTYSPTILLTLFAVTSSGFFPFHMAAESPNTGLDAE